MLGRTSRIGAVAAVALAAGLGTVGVAQAVPVQPRPAPTWQTNGRVNVITVSGSTAYLGGQFTSLRPAGDPLGTGEVTRNHLAAVSLKTGALLPWDPNANGVVRAIRVLGNNVYVGGSFGNVGGTAHQRLAAVTKTTGAVVPGWNASASGEVFTIAGVSNMLYIGGSFSTVDGSPRAHLAALSVATGSLESWAPSANDQVRSLKLIAGNRLIAGGNFTQVNGSSQNHLAALSPTTGASLQWNNDVSYNVIGLATDAHGVYVAGAGGGGNFGAFDPATGSAMWQGGTNGNVQAIGVVGGFVYLGGHFQTYCGAQHGQHTCTTPISRDKLLAVDEDTGSLQGWDPKANSVLGVFALTGDSATGDVLSGGDFTSTGQRKQQGYAQFLP
jgi:PQQ-like domain